MRIPFLTGAAKSASARRRLTLLGAFVILAVAGGIALAASGPDVPTPTITSGPTGPTSQTSASFAFTGVAGVTFQCSLDGSDFTTCTSPKAYAGPLPTGSHTFRVRARNAKGQLSSAASRTWTVDTKAPTLALAFPANGSLDTPAAWSAGCPGGAGVCGSASDPSGVASVRVSVLQQSTGTYWNGAGFASASEVFTTAAGTTSWRLALALPAPDGAYTVHVRATDSLGNATVAGSQLSTAFTIDTQAPPAPQITQAPSGPTSSTHAQFVFTDTEAGAKFLCKLDNGAYASCTSAKSYDGLSQGAHTFSVEARDAAGNVSPATTRTWTVDTVDPPKPAIAQHPSDPTAANDATFAFTDSEVGVGYECRLDDGVWASCANPVSYAGLGLGRHHFVVRALDAAGNRSGSVDFSWKVTQDSGQPFSVSGSLTGLLAPGLSGSLLLKVSNPNSVPIFVTSLTVTVKPGSTKPGCDGPANLQVTQSSASAATPLTVPANGSVTLPAGGVSAPQVLMRNLPTNQDACKGATFSFGYSGSAHS